MARTLRLLVCGGRDWGDAAAVRRTIRELQPTVIIHGAARGADRLADWAADSLGIPKLPFPAKWGLHGKKAGTIRNQQMLDEGKPDMVLAFPGGRGTEDMVGRAEKAGIPVVHYG